jgi:hypothetical protein
MLKGNKGEWSELYVLVSLLFEGKLHQSNINLEKDLTNIYDVTKAYKFESDYSLEFERTNEVSLYMVIDDHKTLIRSFSFEQMKSLSEILYKGIEEGRGSTFPIFDAEDFLKVALIKKLKAPSTVKADIKLKIYDHRLAKETDLGFSIKSLLGGNSTLFNTGVGNNFIYCSKDPFDEDISAFNSRTYSPPNRISKLTYRLSELENSNIHLQFKKIQSNQLWKNLKMIDGDLPEILAWALYYRWIERESSLNSIAKILEQKDPLHFYNGVESDQKFYEYKLKRFLSESAMGMTSETPWLGEYDSFGGVIIAKNNGEILCFHIYDFNLFRDYLINNTVFEQASTGEDAYNPGNPRSSGKRYYYGWLYNESDELCFKINLQIRFK